MLQSMTGFARDSEITDLGVITLEIRTVNHRFLDPNFRMPDLLRGFEPDFREILQNRIARGRVEISIRLDAAHATTASLNFNRTIAKELIEIHQAASNLLKSDKPLTPIELMKMPNVVTEAPTDPESIKPQLIALFNRALDALQANRLREGERIKAMLEERLTAMESLVESAKEIRPLAAEKIKARLLERLESIDVEHSPNRLEEELVYVMQRLDIDEEIDRLKAHIAEMRHVFTRKEPVGRRLDFLSQELNREANTLGSKSQDVELTQIGVDLKVLIEQIREQIQNVE